MPDEMRSSKQFSPAQAGMTLLELIIACAILMILASAAIPVARFTVRRQKESELRRDLREMRDAIDRYKDAADQNQIRVEVGSGGYPPDLQTLVTGVDLTSTTLPGAAVAGIAGAGGLAGVIGAITGQSGSATTPFGAPPGAPGGSAIPAFGSAATSAGSAGTPLIRRVRFLRRIPVDPMTGSAEWGMRSLSDDPSSSSWGGKDVFDVFSQSTSTALDGTLYKDW